MATTIITQQDDRLDLICQRHYGACRGMVEQVLDANPRLAAHGPLLPAGVHIYLPDIAPEREVVQVRLWD